MPITVELHLFSGIPNPRWEIGDDLWESISSREGSVSSPLGNRLGYRGFSLLREDNTLVYSVGTSVARGDSQQGNMLVNMQLDLLKTAPESALPASLRSYVKNSLMSSQGESFTSVPSAQDDVRWNAPGVQKFNNCYNYACNILNNQFAEPGRAGGVPLPQPVFTVADVQASAVADGLVQLPAYPVDSLDKKHYVAFAYWPLIGTADYHWWRLDDNMTWSHKPGESAVLHTDNRGYTINAGNPPDSPPVLGPYTIFGGYYFVPEGIVIY